MLQNVPLQQFILLFFTFIFYFVAWMLLNNHMLHVNVITK